MPDNQRPGVMCYFDLMPAMDQMQDQEVGRLFRAIMQYGKYGILPEFNAEDRGIAIAWSFIQDKIDRDNERYEEVVISKKYASYCQKQKKAGLTPLDRDEWYEHVHMQSRAVTCSHVQPTTTTTTNTNTHTDTDTDTHTDTHTTAAAAATTTSNGSATPEPTTDRDRFDQFWSAYPVRKRRNETLLAWINASRGKGPEFIQTLLQAIEEQKTDEGRKFPSPDAWLKEERWKD